MRETVYRILAINPGSTSTKLSVYDNETQTMDRTIRHDREELKEFQTTIGQKSMRYSLILDALGEAGISLSSIHAVVGRGGLLKPIESGVYRIGERLLKDLYRDSSAVHASCLGGIIAEQIGQENGIPAFVVDPVVVDELGSNAKLSGIPGIERQCAFHALNTKAVARRIAGQIGKPYEAARMVVAHMGGGITVGAHRYGRVIDVNSAILGEGPFTPERSGSIPLIPIIDMCFSGEYTHKEMVDLVTTGSGMQGYLGTNDMREVERMIMHGDSFAAQVLETMAYQVSKEIGGMCAVLGGRVDAIVLTGGLAYSNRFTGEIRENVDQIAPVFIYPGEDEMLALAEGVLRVLRGEEHAREYRP